jgi:hypothetical protein
VTLPLFAYGFIEGAWPDVSSAGIKGENILEGKILTVTYDWTTYTSWHDENWFAERSWLARHLPGIMMHRWVDSFYHKVPGSWWPRMKWVYLPTAAIGWIAVVGLFWIAFK